MKGANCLLPLQKKPTTELAPAKDVFNAVIIGERNVKDNWTGVLESFDRQPDDVVSCRTQI